MSAQHTPGPWTLQPIGDETECNILGARRELVATVSDNDARLIAAAPELLEALRELVDTLALDRLEDGGAAIGSAYAAQFATARAAIAKAAGRDEQDGHPEMYGVAEWRKP